MNNLKITETVLRDANQSLVATRLPISDFVPILDELNHAGYYSLECWGGATFDACLRYLNEDPWERLKVFKKHMPDVKLQMLMRGQCILGYQHYPDDVVREFVRNSVECGIDIIRIFDALNDIGNMKTAVEETLSCGAEPSCAISYTRSPIHSIEKFVSLAKDLESIGAKSISIKDMSGILSPTEAYRLISFLKEKTNVPIILHSHCTSGYAYMTYYEAIRAGVDVVDTAISPFSGGTSQPTTEVIAAIAEELGRKTDLDMKAVEKIAKHFLKVRERVEDERKVSYRSMLTNSNIIKTQIPGGMYSNLIAQLKSMDMLDKLDEVVEETPRVRKDLGYPPLVTPISQMVGVQSVMNVVSGEPYKLVIKEVKDFFHGKYGKPIGEVNHELLHSITGTDHFPEERYAATLPPLFEQVKKENEENGYSDTDVLSLILFPEQAKKYLESRAIEHHSAEAQSMEEEKCIQMSNIPDPENVPNLFQDEVEENDSNEEFVVASLPGSVVEVTVKEGEEISQGQVLMIIETMKMENEIVSDCNGIIQKIRISRGDKVQKGYTMMEIIKE
jgi:oxaloacetate decarboxylase alpha subunit